MLLSREQVRDLDRRAIEEYGIPALVLMENAGRGVAEILQSLGNPGPVVVCCGKGNNGGDGLVAARHLVNRGWTVKVWLFASPETLSAEAAIHWKIVQFMHIPAEVLAGNTPFEKRLAEEFDRTDWIVDALFGTSLTGPLRQPFGRAVSLINASSRKVLAVDIPSGLDADTGEPFGPTIRANHTVTFVAAKIGFAKPTAAEYLGRVHIVDIGAPQSLIQQIGTNPS